MLKIQPWISFFQKALSKVSKQVHVLATLFRSFKLTFLCSGLKNIELKMTFYSNQTQYRHGSCHVCLKSSEQTLRNPKASKLETLFDRRDQDFFSHICPFQCVPNAYSREELLLILASFATLKVIEALRAEIDGL